MHFMKQVSRKFLEEQVKLSLKEIGMQDVGAGSALSKDDNIDPNRILDTAKIVGPMLKAFFLGSDESYEAVGTYLKDLGLYGVGDTKYITKVLDTIPKLTQGPNAGINQTALRFMDVEPFTGEWSSKLTFKPELVKYFTNLRDRWTPILEKSKSNKNRSSIKSALEGMFRGDGGLEDAADKYNFGTSSSIAKIFQSEDSPSVSIDKQIWQEASDENIERYVDYILQSKDTSKAVEILIMSQFPYLRNLTFKQAYTKLATESDLKTLVTGIISFNKFKENGIKALAGAGDIVASLGTTLAFALKPVIATGRAASLANSILKSQFAAKAANTTAKMIKTLGSGPVQSVALIPIALGLVVEIYMGIKDQIEDLQENLDEYYASYSDKSDEEKLEYYNEYILPLIKDIRNKNAAAMYEFFKATKGDDLQSTDFEKEIKLIASDKTFEKTIHKHFFNFDQDKANAVLSSLNKNLEKRTAEVVANRSKALNVLKQLPKYEKELKSLKGQLESIQSANMSIAIPEFSESENTVKTPEEKPDDSIQDSVELLVFGDSIGDGIRSQLGAKGSAAKNLTTGQILKNMEDFFSSQIKERKENKKTIIISGGINDLNSGASPEKILSNIDKMVSLAKSKGYNVRVVPLLGLRGQKQNEIDQINTALANNPNITLIDKSGIELSDGVHPRDYKDLASRSASGVKYKKSITQPTKTAPKTVAKPKVSKIKPSVKASKYWPMVKNAATSEGLDPYLVMGIIFAESGFNPEAVSGVGAEGLMQLMPTVQKQFGVTDAFDPEQNIRGGIKTFKTIRDKYIPLEMKKANAKIDWNSLSEEQKTRLGLYGYNWGARGIVSKLGMNKFNDIDDFFAKVNAWYLSNHGYDYADKIFNYVNAHGGSYSTLSGQVPVAKTPSKKAVEPLVTSDEKEEKRTDTASIQQQIDKVKKAKNFDEVMMAFIDLFGKSFGSIVRSTSDMVLAHQQLNKENLSNFLKGRVAHLKAIHKANYSNWKKEYEEDLKDPKKKDEADKKMGFYHRPILYTTLRPSGAEKFFSGAINMSLGFEPNTSIVSVDYAGGAQMGPPNTFYKEHRKGNSNYSRFLAELDLLNKATSAIQSKVEDLISSGSDKQEPLREMSKYTGRLSEIVSKTNNGLRDAGTSVSRKAYLLSILDLALRTI